MNNSSSLKNCPFCKNQIPFQSEKCPICKVTLIERFDVSRKKEYQSFDANSIKDRAKKESHYNKTYFSKQGYLSKAFEFIKRKRILIAFSFITLILLFYFLQSPNKTTDPNKTLYNYELEEKDKSNGEFYSNSKSIENSRNDNKPIQIEKENLSQKSDDFEPENKKTKDFSNIPEKYIPNGKIFLKNKRYFNGLGELTIKNGTSNDAVVKFVPITLNKSVLTIYVRRNSNLTIKKIKDGNYKLYFVVGRHYDEDSLIFLQDCSFAVFEEGFPFTTEEYRLSDKIKTEYSVFEITLHPVIGGTARTDAITKKKFLLL